MKEVALSFGPGDGLVGVMTLPDGERLAGRSPSQAAGKTGVLFWNAGLLHRVGAARLYVTLARTLAAQGFCALRFDLSGRGDSAAPQGADDDRTRAIGEVRLAMDTLQARGGVERFVLVGLCTGADQAHAVAVADARVAGVVCVDGYAYPTAGFWLRRVGRVLADPERLVGAVGRRMGSGQKSEAGSQPSEVGADGAGMFDWQFPPQAQVRAELEALAARGTRVLYVYSGESAAVYNYAEQFRDMFDGAKFNGRVEAAYVAEADHLFSLPGNGKRFVEVVGRWVSGAAREEVAG